MSTVFIGGSALLLAGGGLALAFGFKSADETLMWTAIAAAVGAAVFLVAGYLVARKEAARRVGEGDVATDASEEAATTAEAPVAVEATPAPAGAPEAAAARTSPGRRRPRSAASTERAAPKRRTAAASGSGSVATAGQVVAVPARKKYHRPECRYASAQGAERMSKTAARRRSLTPCGVCKP